MLELFFCGFATAQSTLPSVKIMETFRKWELQQIVNGSYLSPKDCNLEFTTQDSFEGPLMSLPKEFKAFHADLNEDGTEDALITFVLKQCDGGRASGDAETRILILSKGNSYIVDDSSIEAILAKLEGKGGFVIMENANPDEITGTFFDFKPSDSRCCPSIEKRLSIDINKKQFKFMAR